MASRLDVRADFPLLGRGFAYLDSAATSQKPEQVIAAIDSYYRHSNANIHRGVYALAQEATDLFEGARERVAAFVGGETATTIFTRNATEAINLVAYAWGAQNLGEGDEVLITHMEHHSNIVPWQLLCQRQGAKLRYLHVSEDGRLSLDELDEALSGERVKMVAVAHVSNVLGTINPVAEIAARARAAGAASLIDGSQAVPQLPVNVSEIGADFYVWTGHKALGPTGIGVLNGRRELLESMPPFLGGGDMISTVGFDSSTW
ncbi:MAG: aminotransferase class V-fold PLP-dependent enzyme, partial [Pseudonocardiaceae bacterium]